jgi:hypothetical protein
MVIEGEEKWSCCGAQDKKAPPCIDLSVRVHIGRGRAITASGWPSRARRSGAAAGHTMRKPHPASAYRYVSMSSFNCPHIKYRYNSGAILVSYTCFIS